MKKIRLLALLLTLTVIMSLFSGCKALDKAKENHAYYKDKEQNVIVYKEKEYKRLTDCPDFSPPIDSYTAARTLSEKDQPILWAVLWGGGSFGISKNAELITVYSGCFYAREDVYEDYEKRIKNYEFSEYGVWTFKDMDGEVETELVTVNPEYIDAINRIIETSQITDPGVNAYFDDCIEILATDSEHLFTRKEFDVLFSELEDSYVARTENGILCYYKVAAEDMEILKKFIKEYSNYYNYYTKA